jgi:hypothetical protein
VLSCAAALSSICKSITFFCHSYVAFAAPPHPKKRRQPDQAAARGAAAGVGKTDRDEAAEADAEDDRASADEEEEGMATVPHTAVAAAPNEAAASLLAPARLAAMKAATPARVFQSHWCELEGVTATGVMSGKWCDVTATGVMSGKWCDVTATGVM